MVLEMLTKRVPSGKHQQAASEYDSLCARKKTHALRCVSSPRHLLTQPHFRPNTTDVIYAGIKWIEH
jgi:hypothetical protein